MPKVAQEMILYQCILAQGRSFVCRVDLGVVQLTTRASHHHPQGQPETLVRRVSRSDVSLTYTAPGSTYARAATG